MNILIKEVAVGDRKYTAVPSDNLQELGLSETEGAALIADHIARHRATQVSDACRARIYAVASAETQMNLTAVSVLISAKTANARSVDEKAVLAGLEAVTGWVAEMRAAATTLAAEADADFEADEAWPECPAEALQLLGQY